MTPDWSISSDWITPGLIHGRHSVTLELKKERKRTKEAFRARSWAGLPMHTPISTNADVPPAICCTGISEIMNRAHTWLNQSAIQKMKPRKKLVRVVAVPQRKFLSPKTVSQPLYTFVHDIQLTQSKIISQRCPVICWPVLNLFLSFELRFAQTRNKVSPDRRIS